MSPLVQRGIPGDELVEGGDRVNLDAGDEPGLGRVGDRDDDVACSLPGGGEDERKDAGYRSHGPVEPELADVDDLSDDIRGDRLARDECRDADGEVEAGADLRDRRRREVDDDAAQGNRVTGVGCGRLDPVGGLGAGAVGAAAHAEQRQPGGDVHLDVDEEADDPPQPHRSRTAEGHETAPTTCSIRQGPRRGPQDADDVHPDAGDAGERCSGRPAVGEPGGREPSEPSELAVVDRLDGLAEGRAPPGLDLTDDQAAAVSGDDVDLAEVAAPVAVEDLEAPVGEVAHRHPLAVAAEPTRGVPRHPRGDGPRCVHAPTVPAGMHPRTTPPAGCGPWDGTRRACGRANVPPL